MLTTNDKYTITWRYQLKNGAFWVEEEIGAAGIHKMVFGPIPTRDLVDELIMERKRMIQEMVVAQAKAIGERGKKPRLVA